MNSEAAMNHSLYSADRLTHLKIVVVGILCACFDCRRVCPCRATRSRHRAIGQGGRHHRDQRASTGT